MDEKQIFAEVERRKQRARSLGLVDLVFKLYFEEIRHCAAWSQSSPDSVHPDFQSATEIPKRTLKGVQSLEGVEMPIEGSTFVFAFDSRTTTMPDGEFCYFGTLLLTIDGQGVFGIDCHGSYDDYLGLK